MANSNSTGGQTPTDAFATPETLRYIHGLHDKLVTAQGELRSTNTLLSNILNQQTNLNTELKSIKAEQEDVKNSIDQANSALANVELIIQFFSDRVETTTNMVQTAQNMVNDIYAATNYLNNTGMERIEKVQELVTGFNSKSTTPLDEKWTSPFATSISDAQAYAASAFTAAKKATKAAFEAYVDNLQVATRSQNYLTQFSIFQKELENFISRKKNEKALVDKRELYVNTEKSALDKRVTNAQKLQQAQELMVNQYQQEFNAAQLSAEYTYVPAKSAGA